MSKLLKKVITTTLSSFGLDQSILNRFGTANIPVEANNFERSLIQECGKFSMTGNIRMWALIQSMKYVVANKLNGSFVECGVWKGGNLALMRLFSEHHNHVTPVFGFDTFDGMSKATNEDVDLHGNSAGVEMDKSIKNENIQNIHAYAGFNQVEKNLSLLNAREGVKLVKGMVEHSLLIPENLPDEISILRLDTDWYESTKVELEVLYPKLVKGGVLIIDDYGHFKGAQKAVDDYFKDEQIWLHYVDYTCRLMIKK